MPKANQPNIQDIIASVRAVAAQISLELPEVHAVRAPQVPLLRIQDDEWMQLLDSPALSVSDLVNLQDNIFIDGVYRAVLGRIPDPEGRKSLERALQRGTPKLAIVVALKNSVEGRNNGRQLVGWTWGIAHLSLLEKLLRPIRLGRITHFLFRVIQNRLRAHSSAMGLIAAALTNRLLSQQNGYLQIVAENHLVELQQQLQQTRERLDQLNQAVSLNRHDLLYLQQSAVTEVSALADAPPAPAADARLDAYYVAFEDANRGSREQIREKLGSYRPYLEPFVVSSQAAPLLDIGCGRGEWLALAGEWGLRGEGVDINPVMVQVCRSHGLRARQADILVALAELPSNSRSVITAFHVVEHLPFPVLFSALEAMWRVLIPGGVIILETPNPENLLVGSHTFYHDFTHRNPVTPAAITFLARYLNYEDIEIVRLNPYPEEAKVPGIDLLTERVNGHLCGPQDFALVARKNSKMEAGV